MSIKLNQMALSEFPEEREGAPCSNFLGHPILNRIEGDNEMEFLDLDFGDETK
jgi:hypothetical protein